MLLLIDLTSYTTNTFYRLTLYRGNKDNKNIRIRFYFNNILDYGKSEIEQWH